jgi:hypothetical protein
MKPILGPFVADPNISVALFSFDDTVWVINRRAVHDDPTAAEFGLLEFRDVRAHRVRNRGADLDAPPGCWATETTESEYLAQVIRADEQRTPEALAFHKHYLVNDGNHRTVDIVARDLKVTAIRGPLLPELQRLMSDFALDFN